MKKTAFSKSDILLPADCDLKKWAVVACDQYTSQPEYWVRVADYVADAPSTLHMILPESKLEDENVGEEILRLQKNMTDYLDNNVFQTVEDSMLYVERRLDSGKVRRGLIGKIDLEEYSYAVDSQTPVRATEGTVLSRIPPRMAVRREAAVELPHIMILVDDPEKEIIEPLQKDVPSMEAVYGTPLMEQGGSIMAYAMTDSQCEAVEAGLAKLADPTRFEARYNASGKAPLVFAMGDGNHSLATAKACWEEKKKDLSPSAQEKHPARYALVEIVNLHDESLEFEAIHRVVFDVDTKALLDAFMTAYPEASFGEGEGHQIRYVLGEEEGVITVKNPEMQLEVGTLQHFLDAYLEKVGGKIDYIHGEDVLRKLSKEEKSIGFLLPCMGKDQLFPTVIFDGALPRKTFSMGEAHDKRFYFEARRIQA